MHSPAPRGRANLLTSLLLLSYLCGCGDQSPPRPTPAVSIPTDTNRATKVVAEELQPPKAQLSIQPNQILLDRNADGLQLVALHSQTQADTNPTIDLTRKVAWSVEPPQVAQVDANGFLRPIRPGRARLIATWNEVNAELPIEVIEPTEPAWDFANRIVPILTKQGCNTGGCHGKAEGQNGFQLSLFGYDPSADYDSLTRQAGGRRVDLLHPDSSLLLLKATGQVPHVGGRRINPGSDAERLLRNWIAAGAPSQSGIGPDQATSIVLVPSNQVLPGPESLQLRVLARDAKGQTRDVTRWAIYRSNDDRVASVDDLGYVDLRQPGETDIIVRYQSFVASSRIAAPRPGPKTSHSHELPRSLIDAPIYKRLAALNIPTSPRSTDEVFLRRVSLDLTGQTPEPDQVRSFVTDSAPDKRARTIDELMKQPEFRHFWMLKFGDLLQITSARLGDGTGSYQTWLQKRLTENVGWDVMVRELLTALGNPRDSIDGGPVNYALDGDTPMIQAELAARRFLGLRLRCAQCHNHPFDVWTQDDYYGLAAFFAKIDRGAAMQGVGGMRTKVGLNPEGFVTHLRTGKPVPPRLLDGSPITIANDQDPRRALADWITRPDNPYFARATVNWVWAQFFGRGLVDPPDDMSAANPPSHPNLLEALAHAFIEHGYDLRWLIREIATSETYGLASETVPGNEQDLRLHSHQLPRPLTAHQMADAIARATQVRNIYARDGTTTQQRAIEVFDPATPSTILDTFGRCPRTETCSTVGSSPLTLRQALLVIGGDLVESKVTHLNGYLSHLMELNPQADEIVEFLYYRTLCRPPTDDERSHWSRVLSQSDPLRETAEDLFWALLNSREFAFNH